MMSFSSRLIELMKEKGCDNKSLAATLGLSGAAIIFKWRKGYMGVSLENAIRLADYFNCSLDFLLARSDDYGSATHNACPPFGAQLKKILKQLHSSQYKILRYAHISPKSLNNWLNDKGSPNADTIVRIADFLKITIDYLVGRES